VSERNRLASQPVWLPQGKWVEKCSLAIFSVSKPEGQVLTLGYDLSEVPVFVKSGAVFPTIPPVGRGGSTVIGTARRSYDKLLLTVYPGAESGSTKVYEDDAVTRAYMKGMQTNWTRVAYQRNSTAMGLTVETDPTNFPDATLPSRRKL